MEGPVNLFLLWRRGWTEGCCCGGRYASFEMLHKRLTQTASALEKERSLAAEQERKLAKEKEKQDVNFKRTAVKPRTYSPVDSVSSAPLSQRSAASSFSSKVSAKDVKVINQQWADAGLGSWVGVREKKITKPKSSKKVKGQTAEAKAAAQQAAAMEAAQEEEFNRIMQMAIEASKADASEEVLLQRAIQQSVGVEPDAAEDDVLLRRAVLQSVGVEPDTSEDALVQQAIQQSATDFDRQHFEIEPAPDCPRAGKREGAVGSPEAESQGRKRPSEASEPGSQHSSRTSLESRVTATSTPRSRPTPSSTPRGPNAGGGDRGSHGRSASVGSQRKSKQKQKQARAVEEGPQAVLPKLPVKRAQLSALVRRGKTASSTVRRGAGRWSRVSVRGAGLALSLSPL